MIVLKGCAKVIIISHINSIVLQGNMTTFPVGVLGTGSVSPCSHPCHTAWIFTSCSRDQLSPEINEALFKRGKILVIGIPGRTCSHELQMRNFPIFVLGRSKEGGILKIAYNTLKLYSVGSANVIECLEVVGLIVRDFGTLLISTPLIGHIMGHK
jgi:hypothetical protein